MARQGQRSAPHADDYLRDIPLPRRPPARHPRRRLRKRSHAVAIADAARRLVKRRGRWLNPPEWVEWVDEPVPGYPKRPVACDEAAAKDLKAGTLTNLYNTRPQWLADAHVALDGAVAAAYGWSAGISEEEALRELLADASAHVASIIGRRSRTSNLPLAKSAAIVKGQVFQRLGNPVEETSFSHAATAHLATGQATGAVTSDSQ